MSHRMLLLGAVAALAIAPAPALADAPPSGTIAYAQTFATSPTIAVVAHGGDPRKPLKSSGTNGIHPALSPDGHTMAYIDYDTLDTIPVDARKPTRIAAASLGVAPAWSPNGRQLSYVSKGDLMLVNAKGGSPTRIVDGSGGVTAGASAFLNPTRLLYIQRSDDGSQLRSVATDGSDDQPLAIDLPDGWHTSFSFVSVSASRATIAFAAGNDQTTGIAVAPATGGTATVVPDYTNADFGPTGTQLCARGPIAWRSDGPLSIITATGDLVADLGVKGMGCSWAR